MTQSNPIAGAQAVDAAPRVVVVGTCASGKSSLVAGLKQAGVVATAVGQEHSAVRDLWQRSSPTHVIVLVTDVETIRERRQDPSWPHWLFEEQTARLVSAREGATLTIDTRSIGRDEVLRLTLSHLGVDIGESRT